MARSWWDIHMSLKGGGSWLGTARTWLQHHKNNGETVTWSSNEVLVPPMTVLDVEELAREVAATAIYEAGQKDLCDVCGGTGDPKNGKPCMCQGSGKMSDAAIHLREEVLKLEGELEALGRVTKEELEEAARQLRDLKLYDSEGRVKSVYNVHTMLLRLAKLR